jgi:protein-S-isoprenylcysteine O-methyltransferase Ste14
MVLAFASLTFVGGDRQPGSTRRRVIMIGGAFLYTGLALIAATALRAILDLLQTRPTDPWVFVFAVGCIAASIGLGLTRFTPWKNLEAWTDRPRR